MLLLLSHLGINNGEKWRKRCFLGREKNVKKGRKCKKKGPQGKKSKNIPRPIQSFGVHD